MSLPAHLVEWIEATESDLLQLEPASFYDRFVVGVAMGIGRDPVLIYDRRGIISAHIKDGWTEEEAIEHFEYNTAGAWMGKGTPMFIDLTPEYDCASV
jgi:hypothetical protein